MIVYTDLFSRLYIPLEKQDCFWIEVEHYIPLIYYLVDIIWLFLMKIVGRAANYSLEIENLNPNLAGWVSWTSQN